MFTTLNRAAERLVIATFQRIAKGRLRVTWPGGEGTYGDGDGHHADLTIHDRAFFTRVVSAGEIGLGDAYMDGLWSTTDLVALVRVMLANRTAMATLPRAVTLVSNAIERLAHRARDNSWRGSRRNIKEHYDLGNEFFELFLDPNLLYSCAIYERPDDSLAAAQVNKVRTICDRLELGPDDHVLEIGTGWGGFALYAATRYGCRVTTTTISAEQHAYAVARIARSERAQSLIDVRLDDYRDLTGRFNKIVSIEMFEAVGLRHYDDFFSACQRLLTDDGAMLMQTITVDDWRFADYMGSPSWIAKRIFPGAELASVAEILASQARVTTFGLHHALEIGTHYARTLHQWRERFHARLDDVRAQGFDERFIRMWDLYLGFCEAAFEERHCGDVQLVFTKPACRLGTFNRRRDLIGDSDSLRSLASSAQ
ncbi:MAG TPA: cyclopropane-fatty-acyl-phospholipid synthase family protein [Vicinamibacterales bacterium]|nr:cyclopropane-fatty-acyl-phospholipid synthase family protein [Vicinamibacterales bacterium]